MIKTSENGKLIVKVEKRERNHKRNHKRNRQEMTWGGEEGETKAPALII